MARALAGQMNADASLIQNQPKGTFATFVRGLTERAVPMSWPFFALENLPKTTKADREAIRQHSRNRYAEPWEHKATHTDTSQEHQKEPPEKNDDDDPAAPSPEL